MFYLTINKAFTLNLLAANSSEILVTIYRGFSIASLNTVGLTLMV
jgi:hypothetical protein